MIEDKNVIYVLIFLSLIFFILSLNLKKKELIKISVSPFFLINKIISYISREKKNVDKNKDIINDISEVKNLEENDVK